MATRPQLINSDTITAHKEETFTYTINSEGTLELSFIDGAYWVDNDDILTVFDLPADTTQEALNEINDWLCDEMYYAQPGTTSLA